MSWKQKKMSFVLGNINVTCLSEEVGHLYNVYVDIAIV